MGLLPVSNLFATQSPPLVRRGFFFANRRKLQEIQGLQEFQERLEQQEFKLQQFLIFVNTLKI